MLELLVGELEYEILGKALAVPSHGLIEHFVGDAVHLREVATEDAFSLRSEQMWRSMASTGKGCVVFWCETRHEWLSGWRTSSRGDGSLAAGAESLANEDCAEARGTKQSPAR